MFKFKKVKSEVAGNNNKQAGNQQEGVQVNEFPPDFTAFEIDAIKKVRQFTMTSLERLVSLYRAIDYIEENNIEGDIVECGVWKGGSMMLSANRLIESANTQRELYLFDTFEGMSKPTDKDATYDNQSAEELLSNDTSNSFWCYSSIEEVKVNMYSTGYDKNKIHFIKGMVENTLPYKDINKIAILRLDTDWYESTKHELETLYDNLVVGGILIIDDYGHWSGAKKAVDEFIKNRKLGLFLSRIDYTGRLAVKLK